MTDPRLQMLIDGPSWRHPIHRVRWLLRKRSLRKSVVRLGPSNLGPITLRVRQPDGSTKRVMFDDPAP